MRNDSYTLTEKDFEELAELGKNIYYSLECDIQGRGVPCRSDRWAAVAFMARYLEVHGYEVK